MDPQWAQAVLDAQRGGGSTLNQGVANGVHGAPAPAPAPPLTVAIKRVVCSSKEQEADALREVRAHAVLGGLRPGSRHIPPLLDSVMSADAAVASGLMPGTRERRVLHLLFPMFQFGDLVGRVMRKDAPRLNEAQVVAILCGVADALKFAHERGVAHGDVKPHNVMLNSRDGNPVLIDWGSASFAPLSFVVESKDRALEI